MHRALSALVVLSVARGVATDDCTLLQVDTQGRSKERKERLQTDVSDLKGSKMKGKHQVLIPKPLVHSSGDAELHVTPGLLRMLKEVAKSAGPESLRIVEAQFLSRLPGLPSKVDHQREEELVQTSMELRENFKVHVHHRIELWKGRESWQPIRERDESYGLVVTPHGIEIDARTSWGLANAMSTLYQLLAIRVSDDGVRITVPGCPHKIQDRPAYVHRGFLLDVSRQWYSLPWIKGLVSALAEFKLNVLHLHLTDTASWPLEVDGYPEVARHLAYRDNNGKPLTYSRHDIRQLVEFARVRGMSVMPEIDGPMHAPALASGDPLHLTVAATVEYSTQQFAVEPPPGTWNISDAHALDFVRRALRQVEEDFSTSPFLHIGGDEPVAASLCTLLPEPETKKCLDQCKVPWTKGCEPVPVKPMGANQTYWFPEVLNAKVQDYFDSVDPAPAKIPRAVWSGAVSDCGVQLPCTRLKSKSALQLWEFPTDASGRPKLSEQDCERYDLIQSAATYPEGGSQYGWLYMDCGSGANWASMSPNYWCPRASWAALYSLNLMQGYGPIHTPVCQKAFVGGEMALWSEIGGMGNGMSLIFPRAVAFAERMWSNPKGLRVEEMKGGTPPGWYWETHLRDAMERLNTVVSNLEMLHIGVSHLQPEFCRIHPEFCNAYTASIYAA